MSNTTDIIKLLPDALANQIAAGEVVQRPSSVVKELLENSIDAGATEIKLYLRDAGKTLIMVNDNGKGMSETDARMCFERHATSKINTVNDLFALRTLGFRGEALASIAAVAHVELKTRQHNADLGTRIVVEDSKILIQEPCQCPPGTSIAVKNLFFSVPARKHFLKNNTVEKAHIIDEFQRVALTRPDLHFALYDGPAEVFHLTTGNLRKRIVALMGNGFNERIVPLEETTDHIRIFGFVGKPEFARKTRGEQFFFVNSRFVKSYYLNHAVQNAYEKLLPSKAIPAWFIFIDIDPAKIDVNVHPTKQEIKFDDERMVYSVLNAAVRRALGVHSLTPTLDFESDVNMPFGTFSPKPITQQQQKPNKDEYDKNDTEEENSQTSLPHIISIPSKYPQSNYQKNKVPKNWQDAFKTNNDVEPDFDNLSKQANYPDENEAINNDNIHQQLRPNNPSSLNTTQTILLQSEGYNTALRPQLDLNYTDKPLPVQIHNKYILVAIKSGMLLIDQQAAHERVLYERFNQHLHDAAGASQQLLFPETINLNPADATLMAGLLPMLSHLGYNITQLSNNSFAVNGVPSDLVAQLVTDNTPHFEQLIEQFKQQQTLSNLPQREKLAMALARNKSIKQGQKLAPAEMQHLIDLLFACNEPQYSPMGKYTFITWHFADLDKLFLK
ncbi:MAG: DNA mismatch repair endonuclease MutL [Sphingobacteriales bacterium]|jgi:DNA mismatch repair protein MutL|nr:DNA mismatch repair endonuclease MutL [Sphingobacteriales bacterium]MBP9141718.1 DNA mismatch repair endonuclease MutL [Chitinophagales bacterium]MDA0198513.1 DNA mismatch repair endonuclease MutL [Bacteroidota bacterium]MBK6888614.1 DNA mismatch repair endonuclease MutL [Sphingobacteriales bacterium]MBK7528878.1 DNA mismatch repair endonuclease MutL [Sphingobacteriales bacterium]